MIMMPLFLTDLQLAAELGKTLLERNKELENLLRSHQRKCEDQKQEIEVSSDDGHISSFIIMCLIDSSLPMDKSNINPN